MDVPSSIPDLPSDSRNTTSLLASAIPPLSCLPSVLSDKGTAVEKRAFAFGFQQLVATQFLQHPNKNCQSLRPLATFIRIPLLNGYAMGKPLSEVGRCVWRTQVT